MVGFRAVAVFMGVVGNVESVFTLHLALVLKPNRDMLGIPE